jgi:hypothetical protein
MDGAGDTVPPDGVVFLSTNCGGGGVELLPSTGTATTSDHGSYEMIEFHGLTGDVPIAARRGEVWGWTAGKRHPDVIASLHVDPAWRRPVEPLRIEDIRHHETAIACPSDDDFIFRLSRGAAGLELRWIDNGNHRVALVGVRRSHRRPGGGATAVWPRGDTPSPGSPVAVTVIEGDGSRNVALPPVVVMPELRPPEPFEIETETAPDPHAASSTPRRRHVGPVAVIVAIAGLLVVGAALRRRSVSVEV